MVPTVHRPRHNYWRRRIRGSVTFPDSTGIVANNTHPSQLGLPMQSHIANDNLNLCAAVAAVNGSAEVVPKMYYALASNRRFHVGHNFPNAPKMDNGQALTLAWRPDFGLWMYSVFDRSVTPVSERVSHIGKGDNDFNTSLNFTTTTTGVASRHPSMVIDKDGFTWSADVSSTGDVRVRRSTDPFTLNNGFDAATTIRTGLTFASSVQLVTYSNGDVGAFYCDTLLTLYYQHYTAATDSWEGAGSERIIDTDVTAWYNWRVVVTRNDQAVILWKDGTSNDLRFRIYDQTGDAFNSAADFATDINSASGSYYTSCADIGQAESVYVFYHDGTNIVRREWNGSTVSGKTTFISSVTLMTGTFTNLSSSFFESQKIPVMYQLSDGTIKVDTFDLTPTQESTDGTLVTLAGHADVGTHHFGTDMMVTKGNFDFILDIGLDQIAYATVYNNSTQSVHIARTQIGGKRYVDISHNGPSCFIDDTGKIIYMEGGRDGVTTENLIMLQSDFALDSGSFSLTRTGGVLDDWSDISPTALTGRGYKQVVVDQGGIPHLFFMTDISTMTVREYRSNSWSAPKTIVSLTDGDNQLYWCGVKLGKEPSGQKSLLAPWCFTDKSVVPTDFAETFYSNEMNYLRLIPDGAGDYTGARADGVSLTLPCSEVNKDCIISAEDTGGTLGATSWAATTAYALDDVILESGYLFICTTEGTSGGSIPTFDTDHHQTTADNTVVWTELAPTVAPNNEFLRCRFMDNEIVDTTNPLGLAYHVDDTDPHAFNTLKSYKWDATNWVPTTLQSADFPTAGRRVNAAMVIGTQGVFVVAPKIISGVQELVQYQSEDNGDTWDAGTQLTNSSFGNETPMLSNKSATLENLVFHRQIHIGYAETMFLDIEISAIVMIKLFAKSHLGVNLYDGGIN